MTIDELLGLLDMQEEILQFSHFTNADAWEVGNCIVAEAIKRKLPVAVSIRLNNGLTVFQYASDSVNLQSERWLQRKMNTVRTLERSSLYTSVLLRKSEETLADWYLDEKDYAACGGGFPIRIEEVGVIGAILVEGQDHFSDHDLIVKSISRYLHIDEVPRIRTQMFKIIRNRGSKIHGLSTDRVAESQPTRVESLSFYKPVIRIVKIVSWKRVADVVHMNPDLMRTSRFQL